MRQSLLERAWRRKAEKYGDNLARVQLSESDLLIHRDPAEILALDEALEQLAQEEPEAAELVKLRIFADFTVEETGHALGISRATAYRQWTYARAWLKSRMAKES